LFILAVQDATTGKIIQRLPIDRDREVLVGRSEGNHIVLPGAGVSRRHARIYMANGRLFIQDLQSSNGALLNGRRVVGTAEVPMPRARIDISNFIILVEQVEPKSTVGPAMRPPPPANNEQRRLSTHIVNDSRPCARLQCIAGPFRGEEFTLSERENTIGRTEDNFLLLPDPSISRRHARIVRTDDDRYVLYDLQSSNGTTVNRHRTERAVLHHNDIVSFGDVTFRFLYPDGPAAERSLGLTNRFSPGQVLLIIVVACAVAAAGVMAAYRFSKVTAEATRQKEKQQMRQGAMERAKAAMEKKRWERAIQELESLLAETPDDAAARKALAKAKAEADIRDKLRRADVLFIGDKYDEAHELLKSVPEESVYHEQAVSRLDTIARQKAAYLLKKGLAACSKRHYLDCHRFIGQSLDIAPANTEAVKKLRWAEREMRRRRISFEPWRPHRHDTKSRSTADQRTTHKFRVEGSAGE